MLTSIAWLGTPLPLGYLPFLWPNQHVEDHRLQEQAFRPEVMHESCLDFLPLKRGQATVCYGGR